MKFGIMSHNIMSEKLQIPQIPNPVCYTERMREGLSSNAILDVYFANIKELVGDDQMRNEYASSAIGLTLSRSGLKMRTQSM